MTSNRNRSAVMPDALMESESINPIDYFPPVITDFNWLNWLSSNVAAPS